MEEGRRWEGMGRRRAETTFPGSERGTGRPSRSLDQLSDQVGSASVWGSGLVFVGTFGEGEAEKTPFPRAPECDASGLLDPAEASGGHDPFEGRGSN